MQKVNYLL